MKYCIDPQVKMREETFGGVIQTKINLFLLNQEEYTILKRFIVPKKLKKLTKIARRLLEIGALCELQE